MADDGIEAPTLVEIQRVDSTVGSPLTDPLSPATNRPPSALRTNSSSLHTNFSFAGSPPKPSNYPFMKFAATMTSLVAHCSIATQTEEESSSHVPKPQVADVSASLAIIANLHSNCERIIKEAVKSHSTTAAATTSHNSSHILLSPGAPRAALKTPVFDWSVVKEEAQKIRRNAEAAVRTLAAEHSQLLTYLTGLEEALYAQQKEAAKQRQSSSSAAANNASQTATKAAKGRGTSFSPTLTVSRIDDNGFHTDSSTLSPLPERFISPSVQLSKMLSSDGPVPVRLAFVALDTSTADAQVRSNEERSESVTTAQVASGVAVPSAGNNNAAPLSGGFGAPCDMSADPFAARTLLVGRRSAELAAWGVGVQEQLAWGNADQPSNDNTLTVEPVPLSLSILNQEVKKAKNELRTARERFKELELAAINKVKEQEAKKRQQKPTHDKSKKESHKDSEEPNDQQKDDKGPNEEEESPFWGSLDINSANKVLAARQRLLNVEENAALAKFVIQTLAAAEVQRYEITKEAPRGLQLLATGPIDLDQMVPKAPVRASEPEPVDEEFVIAADNNPSGNGNIAAAPNSFVSGVFEQHEQLSSAVVGSAGSTVLAALAEVRTACMETETEIRRLRRKQHQTHHAITLSQVDEALARQRITHKHERLQLLRSVERVIESCASDRRALLESIHKERASLLHASKDAKSLLKGKEREVLRLHDAWLKVKTERDNLFKEKKQLAAELAFTQQHMLRMAQYDVEQSYEAIADHGITNDSDYPVVVQSLGDNLKGKPTNAAVARPATAATPMKAAAAPSSNNNADLQQWPHGIGSVSSPQKRSASAGLNRTSQLAQPVAPSPDLPPPFTPKKISTTEQSKLIHRLYQEDLAKNKKKEKEFLDHYNKEGPAEKWAAEKRAELKAEYKKKRIPFEDSDFDPVKLTAEEFAKRLYYQRLEAAVKREAMLRKKYQQDVITASGGNDGRTSPKKQTKEEAQSTVHRLYDEQIEKSCKNRTKLFEDVVLSRDKQFPKIPDEERQQHFEKLYQMAVQKQAPKK